MVVFLNGSVVYRSELAILLNDTECIQCVCLWLWLVGVYVCVCV